MLNSVRFVGNGCIKFLQKRQYYTPLSMTQTHMINLVGSSENIKKASEEIKSFVEVLGYNVKVTHVVPDGSSIIYKELLDIFSNHNPASKATVLINEIGKANKWQIDKLIGTIKEQHNCGLLMTFDVMLHAVTSTNFCGHNSHITSLVYPLEGPFDVKCKLLENFLKYENLMSSKSIKKLQT